eukprot:GHVO01017331.1.p1 GENE.GHVO01017331.1~~GHVO01017331.1.p1  ORF type:complete len:163 (-),score=0.06 GHVO01017331.1:120-608(-)
MRPLRDITAPILFTRNTCFGLITIVIARVVLCVKQKQTVCGFYASRLVLHVVFTEAEGSVEPPCTWLMYYGLSYSSMPDLSVHSPVPREQCMILCRLQGDLCKSVEFADGLTCHLKSGNTLDDDLTSLASSNIYEKHCSEFEQINDDSKFHSETHLLCVFKC